MAWEKVELGEICEFKYGKGLPQRARVPGEYPVFGSNGVVGFHEECLVSAPTIIIGRKGSIGEVHVSEIDCWPIDTTYYINEFDERISFEWLVYVLSHNTQLKMMNKAAAVPGLNRNDAYSLQIPLPPLPEQRRLAALLDRADALRRRDEALLEAYEALGRSVFLEMFGDPFNNQKGFPHGTIRDLVSEVKYGTSKKAGTEGQFPYLRMNNITYSGNLDITDLKYIDLNEKEQPKYLAEKGDVLFNRTNSKELVGKTTVFNLDSPMALAGYIIRVRTNKNANPYFISGYLNSRHGKLILENMCKNIVGMANINAQELQDIKILIPPIPLQNHFARIIENLESQKQKVRAQRAQSEALFQGLLQRAFRGEV